MNKNRYKATLLLLLLGLANIAQAAQGTGNLTVLISGFRHDGGLAVVKLFRKQDDVMGKSFQRIRVSISTGRSTAVFTNLPYGEYALMAFHDENVNGELDHNFLRFPKEHMGFSGGFSLGLFSGFPSFLKLRFVFAETSEKYHIKINNNKLEKDG